MTQTYTRPLGTRVTRQWSLRWAMPVFDEQRFDDWSDYVDRLPHMLHLVRAAHGVDGGTLGRHLYRPFQSRLGGRP